MERLHPQVAAMELLGRGGQAAVGEGQPQLSRALSVTSFEVAAVQGGSAPQGRQSQSASGLEALQAQVRRRRVELGRLRLGPPRPLELPGVLLD